MYQNNQLIAGQVKKGRRENLHVNMYKTKLLQNSGCKTASLDIIYIFIIKKINQLSVGKCHYH